MTLLKNDISRCHGESCYEKYSCLRYLCLGETTKYISQVNTLKEEGKPCEYKIPTHEG